MSNNKGSKNMLKKGAPGAPVGSAMAEIMDRAEGGRIAVLERGSKPKVVDAKQLISQGDSQDMESSEQEVGKPEIHMSKESADIVRDSFDILKNIDNQLVQLLVQYETGKNKLIEERENRSRELQNLIGSMGRRFNVPDGWTLDLDRMVFVPSPPEQRQQQPVIR